MWSVVPPAHGPRSTFATCLSQVQDPDLRDRFEEATDEITDAADRYDHAGQMSTFHELSPDEFQLTGISADEMVALYSGRMAKKRAAGRIIYDELKSAAIHGRCPLCGQRIVETLDHHLPKTIFPALAVNPMNLIPCCSDCNKMKTSSVPSSAEEQTLHPYYDNIEAELWLKASVVHQQPAAMRFYVDPPVEWEATLRKRVQRHFKLLRLSSLYASHAAQELANIQHVLSKLLLKGGAELVKDHLNDQAESRRKARINSWQTATYSALELDVWFYEGGFQPSWH
jgi:hypothetical protein